MDKCWVGDCRTKFVVDDGDVKRGKHRRDDGDGDNNGRRVSLWSCASYAMVGMLHVSFRGHGAWIKVLEDELLGHVGATL